MLSVILLGPPVVSSKVYQSPRIPLWTTILPRISNNLFSNTFYYRNPTLHIMSESKVDAQHFEDNTHGEKHVVDTEPVDHKGDLGAAFYAEYTGPRTEITDHDSDSVRWRIDKFLLPM